MKRFTILAAGAVALFVGLVLWMVPIALVLTQVANVTNTSMGFVSLLLWVLISVAAVLLCRGRLPLPLLLAVICVAWPVSAYAYHHVGYHYFGWIGLMKGNPEPPLYNRSRSSPPR